MPSTLPASSWCARHLGEQDLDRRRWSSPRPRRSARSRRRCSTEMNSRMAVSVPTSCGRRRRLSPRARAPRPASGGGLRIWLMSAPVSAELGGAARPPRLRCQAVPTTLLQLGVDARVEEQLGPGSSRPPAARQPCSRLDGGHGGGPMPASSRRPRDRVRSCPDPRRLSATRSARPGHDHDGRRSGPSSDRTPASTPMPMMATAMSTGEDEEGPGAQALAHLPLGDEGDRRARRPSSARHRAAGRPRTARAARR